MVKPGEIRRLVAILAADMVGYSRLMEVDESGTLGRLKTHRKELIDPRIAAHKGRIVKTTGDGMLVEFASAVEAVACAVEIQQGMARRNEAVAKDIRIEFRTGVHLGDVIIDGDDIFGDGVNVAARLEGLADAGGVSISIDVHRQVEGKLDLAFEDLGERKVKNLTRPIHVFRVRMESGAGVAVARADAKAGSASPTDKPTIAVLPFDNLSGDAEQDYFADGMAEDILTALSKFHWLFVIARNSSFTYKGQAVDIKQVGRELGARYVLEGSVRKAGQRVRVTAQLIDALSGNHLWAERFDGDLADVFELQDEVSLKIVSSIVPELRSAEITALLQKHPENLGSWELYLRGMANMPTYGKHRDETKGFFEQAIEADPSFADAYVGLALCYSADIYAFRAHGVEKATGKMFELADRAEATDPRNFRIYLVRCMAYFWKGELKEAVEAGRRAVALNPSSADAHEALAAALSSHGEAEEAERCAETCLRLSPLDPRLNAYYMQRMQARLGQRRFADAYDDLGRCMATRPHDVVLLGFKTVLLGHLDRNEEAAACLKDYLAKRKIETADDYRRIFVRNSALVEINLEGLRKAGWKV